MRDHPIFLESIRLIQKELGHTNVEPLHQRVLERMIHTSGDFSVANLLRFSPEAFKLGLTALIEGSVIIADTSMATVAIKSMSQRTINTPVKNILDWAPKEISGTETRTAFGMRQILKKCKDLVEFNQPPIVVVGSAPTALEVVLDLVEEGEDPPSLVIGMPVGFVGVEKSKNRLMNSKIPFIALEGTRGGAALAASVVNALLREAVN